MPLPGVGPAAARGAVGAACVACANIRGAGGTALDRFNAYQRWSNQAVVALSGVLRRADVDRLVAGPRYFALQALDPTAHGDLGAYVDIELDRARAALDDARRALETAEARLCAQLGPLAVPDTNVLLHHPAPFDQIDWPAVIGSTTGAHLIVPLLVVDELDRAKRASGTTDARDGRERVRTRARTTLRTFEDAFSDPAAVALVRPAGPNGPAVHAELLMDPPGHRRLPDPDSELVDRAAAARDLYGRDVTIVSYDTAMLLRARAARLPALRPSENA